MSNLADRVQELEEQLAMMEPALRSAQASQGVHEFVIVHLLSHLGAMTSDRDASIAAILQGIEMSIKMQADAVRKEYGERAEKSLSATFDYFESFKRKVIATVEIPSTMIKN